MGGISIWQLLIVLAIVLVLFGAKRLRTLGTDLGSAVKGFRSAVKEGEEDASEKDKLEDQKVGQTYDSEATSREKNKV